MRKRRGETRQQRAKRKAGPDYPRSTVDGRERRRYEASKYIPSGRDRNIPAGHR